MYDQASIRSTIDLDLTPEQKEDLLASDSVWSDVVRVIRKTKNEGQLEQLQWRVEVRKWKEEKDRVTKFRVRLHWLEGEAKLYWRHSGHRRRKEFCKEEKVEEAKPGSIINHGESLKISKKEMQQHVRISVQMDIMADVNQNDGRLEDDANAREDFGLLLDSGDMADMSIVCGQQEFPCHKIILSCRSPVLEALFSHRDFEENQRSRIEIEDFEPFEVKQFLKFAYCNKCDFYQVDPWRLLALGDKYLMKSLTNYCAKVI